MTSILESLQIGLQFQQKGQIELASKLYNDVLAVDPNQADALHLLGLIETNRGNHDRAIEMISRASQLMPTSEIFLSNLGVVFKNAGRLEQAVEAYRKAIAINPTSSSIRFNLGKSLKQLQQYDEAKDQFEKAVELDRSNSAPWLSLMSLYSEGHHLDSAISIADRAFAAFPNHPEILINIGAIQKRCSEFEKALETYKRIVQFDPVHIDALCRVASTCFALHRVNEGIPYLDRARAIAPNSGFVLACTGLLHNTLNNATEAIKAYRLATQQQTNIASPHSCLAAALRKVGEFSEGLLCASHALTLEPENAECMAVRAGMLLSLGDHVGALYDFRRAIDTRRGNYKDAHQSLLMCLQYLPGISPEKLYEEHLDWARIHSGLPATYDKLKTLPTIKSATTTASAGGLSKRRIHIGFVSGDLGAHPVGYFTAKLFESIDRDRFAVHVYSDRLGEDWLNTRLRSMVEKWYDTAHMADKALHQQIETDQIEILIDLAGHTAQNRLLLFAKRSAPVQISWAGYVGTTGLEQMDYLLADRFHIPPELENHYLERVLRMPHGYVSYTSPPDAPDIGPLPMIANGYATLGAMCNPAKVNEEVLQRWGQILCQLPDSRMHLCYNGWPDPGNQKRVEQVFASYGCENRTDYHQTSGAASLMHHYNQIDIALDTFPYSGGLTTIEAMWMGVPTITWPQSTFAGRHSLSHLSNVGLLQCIADTAQKYVEIAVAMAKQVEVLVELRRTLRDRVSQSPLCDGPAFARSFESLMEGCLEQVSQLPGSNR